MANIGFTFLEQVINLPMEALNSAAMTNAINAQEAAEAATMPTAMKMQEYMSFHGRQTIENLKYEMQDLLNKARAQVEGTMGEPGTASFDQLQHAVKNLSDGATSQELAALGRALEQAGPQLEQFKHALDVPQIQKEIADVQHALQQVENLPEVHVVRDTLHTPDAQAHFQAAHDKLQQVYEESYADLSPQSQQMIQQLRESMQEVMEGKLTGEEVQQLGQHLREVSESAEIQAEIQQHGPQLQEVQGHIQQIQDMVQQNLEHFSGMRLEDGAEVVTVENMHSKAEFQEVLESQHITNAEVFTTHGMDTLSGVHGDMAHAGMADAGADAGAAVSADVASAMTSAAMPT